jgi:hypothetical protein
MFDFRTHQPDEPEFLHPIGIHTGADGVSIDIRKIKVAVGRAMVYVTRRHVNHGDHPCGFLFVRN